MGTLKLQNNGSLHRNTVIGTLAVDGWTVRVVVDLIDRNEKASYIWYCKEGTGQGRSPPRPLLAVPM